ncbi:MAG TPA: PKD domain-containing protein [Chitinophagales bacterium]|nr:PKD domain-containing protein [Chitinophagales bacterium]
MKPHFTFSAMKKVGVVQRALALLLFAALISFSKNSSACNASFIDSTYGTSVQFINVSVAANSAYWYWTFGDGTWSDLENPVHVYNAYGPFLVCLTVHDTANNCIDTYCDSVYFSNGGCQAYFNYNDNGLNVDFTNLSTGNYTSVIWDLGDNTTSYFNNPSHTYAIGGYYYVCVTVSDTGNNCNDTYCQYIYVNDSAQLCNAAFSYTGNGTTIQFFNNSFTCNYANWYWTFGDGASSTSFDPSHQYASAGYYNVCLSMYDSYCACADTVCETVYAGGNNLPCNAEFVLYPDSFQQGLYWGYNYSTGNNLVYYWSWGDGGYATGPYPSHVYIDSGYYTICLSILDTVSQCSDSVCTNYYILKQEKLDQIHEVIFVNATAVPPVTGSDNIQWNIFPNPASTDIRIETNAGKIDAVRITDVSGRVIKQIFSYTNDFISLQSLPQGAYIVQTLIGGTWRSKLLIRQ